MSSSLYRAYGTELFPSNLPTIFLGNSDDFFGHSSLIFLGSFSLYYTVSISELMGILKGKTAIALFKGKRDLKKKPYWGNHFWSRGYCVTTIGMDEEKIRRYVKYQEENERIEENNSKEYGLF